MSPVARIVQAMKRIPVLGGRVYPGAIPQSEPTYPIAVVRRAGGVTLPVDFGDGVPIPLISIQVYDTDYARMDAAMQEAERYVEQHTFTVFDPPEDGWHETLNAHAQQITVTVQPG